MCSQGLCEGAQRQQSLLKLKKKYVQAYEKKCYITAFPCVSPAPRTQSPASWPAARGASATPRALPRRPRSPTLPEGRGRRIWLSRGRSPRSARCSPNQRRNGGEHCARAPIRCGDNSRMMGFEVCPKRVQDGREQERQRLCKEQQQNTHTQWN